MKILSASQIRATDAFTIENEPVASIDLMERAAKAFVSAVENRIPQNTNVLILCGKGNNGGDGLAIARLLLQKSYKVKVIVINISQSSSEDFDINLLRLSDLLKVEHIISPSDFKVEEKNTIVIDALFGSGLTRPLAGEWTDIVKMINTIDGTKIAVDISSGLSCDEYFAEGEAVNVDNTISFQLPKLAFFARDNFPKVGDWEVCDIGLDKGFIGKQETTKFSVDLELVKSLFKLRDKFSHKGSFGKSLLITGSLGKMGASILASKACLISGTGLLTIHSPKVGYEILQTSVPEAMVSIDAGDEFIETIPDLKNYTAIGIGPGIDKKDQTTKAVSELLSKWDQPIVIDADAINIISENRHLLNILPENSILTPHPKEFERLIARKGNSFENWDYQLEFSNKHKVYMVLKGAHTSISTPNGEMYFNTSGNPGMATGGSGDVLTGILTAMLAQGYSSMDTAIIGVFIHGKSGDLMAEKRSETSLIASDLIEGIPEVFRLLS